MKFVTNILTLIWHQIITTYEGLWIKPCAFSASVVDEGKWSASHSSSLVMSEMHNIWPENKFT